jgi:hypothetical protein
MSAMTSLQSREKPTSNGSFMNCITPVAPNAVTRRLKKSVEGDPDQDI